MAAPTAWTSTLICTEALKRASISSPTATELTRAASWLEEVKRDVTRERRYLKSLFTTSYGVTTIGKSKYALPSDYIGNLSVTVLDGTNTGTAQAGAANTITLASDEDITSAAIIGRYILVISGTGLNSYGQCTGYDETTKIATVAANWATNPASGSGYMVVDTSYPLGVALPIQQIDSALFFSSKSLPLAYSITGNATTGDITLYPAPDKVYGLQYRYYLNLQTLDLSGTLLSTLYENYVDVFIQGVLVRQTQDLDDARYAIELGLYKNMLKSLADDEFDSENFLEDVTVRGSYSTK